MVEAKIGKGEICSEQIERYLNLAKANGIDAIITLSNQFVARADHYNVNHFTSPPRAKVVKLFTKVGGNAVE